MASEKKIGIENHLTRLSDMTDYEVADRDPDVRGWKVFSAEGVKFGKVEDLIVDPDEMKVRYLDVEVDEGVEGVSEERHLLIPVGVASVDAKDDKVFIQTIQTVSLLKTPSYKGGAITREYEDELRKQYFEEKERREDEDYYSSEYYNEDNFFRARRKKDGSLQLIAASSLIGERVANNSGSYIGRIEEVMVDINYGKIAYTVLSFGEGALGLADKYYAVPWEIIKTDSSTERYFLSVPESKIQNAPEYDKDDLHSTMDENLLNEIYNYYGVKSYKERL
jgi:sporulation protein YlmC with PRC-barrel domain